MIQTSDLIRVATIKKKHLEQVHLVPLLEPEHKQLRTDLMEGSAVVRYWFNGNAIGFTSKTCWLVEGPKPGHLRIMFPPDSKDYEGNPVDLWEKFKDAPQLFAD